LFYNKDVLDIGCNIGHVTYLIARDLGAKTVLGIDIDNSLIQIARKNAKYYSCLTSPAVTGLLKKCDITMEEDRKETELTFPNEARKDTRLTFPDNVSFLHVRIILYYYRKL
jgi:7SK snRNA methylphosphate capping enzyme